MSKLDDKKKLKKKTDPAVKAIPKKANVELTASKLVVAKSSKKLKKHIADEIEILPSKRVWPD